MRRLGCGIDAGLRIGPTFYASTMPAALALAGRYRAGPGGRHTAPGRQPANRRPHRAHRPGTRRARTDGRRALQTARLPGSWSSPSGPSKSTSRTSLASSVSRHQTLATAGSWPSCATWRPHSNSEATRHTDLATVPGRDSEPGRYIRRGTGNPSAMNRVQNRQPPCERFGHRELFTFRRAE